MSYDLQIWSVNAVNAYTTLPEAERWKPNNQTLVHERRDWQIVVGRSVDVLPEDIPEDVANALPGISYLTELNLSPIDSPEAARKFLTRSCTALAKAAHGVIFDPQVDQLTLPSGIRRFAKPIASEDASVVSMSWWLVEGPIARGEFAPLLEVLGRHLPEALPRRYGSFEPPQHIYSETGREHFLRFLSDHLRGKIVVWYPSAPVVHVHLGLPDNIGPSRRGFRAAYFTIDVDTDALSQAGWQAAMKRLWRSASQVLQPFYGDVRTRSGYRRNRGRYMSARTTQRHPVISWWWCGLPPGPAQAVVLGKPYDALWPAFSKIAAVHSGLAFAETEDWRSADDVFAISGVPPADVRLVDWGGSEDPVPRAYPVTWPFDPPRLP